MTYADNPAYIPAVTASDGDTLYMPADVANGYHISRKVAASAQDIYAASGATKEVTEAIVKQMLNLCNADKPSPTYRTDIGTLCNNLLYRMRYPVDELCAIRMAAIYLFAEGEDPDRVQDFWTQKKVTMAMDDPELYSFFLTLGVELTSSWKASSDTLTGSDYFNQRRETLRSLTPQPLSPTS